MQSHTCRAVLYLPPLPYTWHISECADFQEINSLINFASFSSRINQVVALSSPVLFYFFKWFQSLTMNTWILRNCCSSLRYYHNIRDIVAGNICPFVRWRSISSVNRRVSSWRLNCCAIGWSASQCLFWWRIVPGKSEFLYPSVIGHVPLKFHRFLRPRSEVRRQSSIFSIAWSRTCSECQSTQAELSSARSPSLLMLPT
jgi:hypothetical protein